MTLFTIDELTKILEKKKILDTELRKQENLLTTTQFEIYSEKYKSRDREIFYETRKFIDNRLKGTFKCVDVEFSFSPTSLSKIKYEYESELLRIYMEVYFDQNNQDESMIEKIFKSEKGEYYIVEIIVSSLRIHDFNKIEGNLIEVSKTNNKKCFIATLCYCSFDSDEVIKLRKFRDNVLMKNNFGRGFIKVYYWISPILVEHLKNRKRLISLLRKFVLDPIIKNIKVY